MMTITSRTWLVAGAVLTPLICAGCGVSQKDYNALKTENTQLRSQNQQLQSQNTQLQSQNQDLQANVGRLQHAMAYTVNSDLLFKSGSWEMSDRGKDIISKLSQKLAPTQQNKLMVSGYTDNQPIGAKLKQEGVTSNQDLSEKRADAVMQYLVSQGVKQDMVAAQGYGDSDPIAPNDTSAGRAQNRRVVLSVGGETAASGSSTQQ